MRTGSGDSKDKVGIGGGGNYKPGIGGCTEPAVVVRYRTPPPASAGPPIQISGPVVVVVGWQHY